MEKICTNALEGVSGVLWFRGWHGRVTWCIPGACGASSTEVDHVGSQIGPVERCSSPLEHGGSTSVASVEVLQHIVLQGPGDDRSIMQHDHWTNGNQGVSVWEEVQCLDIPIFFIV